MSENQIEKMTPPVAGTLVLQETMKDLAKMKRMLTAISRSNYALYHDILKHIGKMEARLELNFEGINIGPQQPPVQSPAEFAEQRKQEMELLEKEGAKNPVVKTQSPPIKVDEEKEVVTESKAEDAPKKKEAATKTEKPVKTEAKPEKGKRSLADLAKK